MEKITLTRYATKKQKWIFPILIGLMIGIIFGSISATMMRKDCPSLDITPEIKAEIIEHHLQLILLGDGYDPEILPPPKKPIFTTGTTN